MSSQNMIDLEVNVHTAEQKLQAARERNELF